MRSLSNIIKGYTKDYVVISDPKYTFLKITPSTSIRNYNSDKILSTLSTLGKDMNRGFKIANKQLCYEQPLKIGFYLYMEKDKIEFYFIVPYRHFHLFKDRLMDTWSNKVNIEEVDSIPMLELDCSKYCMCYKKNDAMSLDADKKNNYLLESLFNVVNIMEDEDKIAIMYSFKPSDNRYWKETYDCAIEKLQNGERILQKNNLKFKDLLIYVLSKVAYFANDILSLINMDSKVQKKQIRDLDLSYDTKKKRELPIVKTQIVCMSQSNDKFREVSNCLSVCSSFDAIKGDNELDYHKVKIRKNKLEKFNLLDGKIYKCNEMSISNKEGQNFISLPSKELIDEYSFIECSKVRNNKISKELSHGYLSMGTMKINSSKDEFTMYFPDDKGKDVFSKSSLVKVIYGSMGSGKTTFISNLCHDTEISGEGFMLIDFIRNNELAYSIIKTTPKEKTIILDMSKDECLQGFGFNEFVPKSNHAKDIYQCAIQKSLYTQMLIDSVNISNTAEFTPAMDELFSSCCNVVFLQRNTSLRDVARCINNHVYRLQCLDAIPFELRAKMEDEIVKLNSINDIDKNTKDVIGTKSNSTIDGINARINILKKDYRLKEMFNMDSSKNFDLVSAMEQGKCVFILMPQECFATQYSKNVLVTYWFLKVWESSLIYNAMCGRNKTEVKRFGLFIDEIFQSKTIMEYLANNDIINQLRKFGLCLTLTAMNNEQLSKIDGTLRSSGAHYCFLRGVSEKTYLSFKSDLEPYTYDDLKNLPQYSSLNMINTNTEGTVKFITKLPKPL